MEEKRCNMQRYFAKSKDDNSFTLDIKDIHHIKNVMRLKDGELVEVVFDKKLFICCLENVKENLIIKLDHEVKEEHFDSKKINLLIPFLKEQKMDLILQKATELGAYEITLIPLERSIIKVNSKNLDAKKDRWNRILKEASEQSKRVDIPILNIADNLSSIANMDGLNLFCSTKKMVQSIKKVVKNNSEYDKINIVIGPEGGLSDKEEEKLSSYGYLGVSLGDRIMRVETVPLYLLSVINYEFME